jgi:hypothetical protein
MSLAATIQRLRQSAATVSKFYVGYIRDSDAADKLFEFDAMLEIVERLRTAGAGTGVVQVGPKGEFARAPGKRQNFNWIEQGSFRIDFGTEFEGQSSASHAPDVSLTHVSMPDRIILAIECKCHGARSTDKDLIMAFTGVLIDLLRPTFPDSNGQDVIPGVGRASDLMIDALVDADTMRTALGDGRSYFVTTSAHAPDTHGNVARCAEPHLDCPRQGPDNPPIVHRVFAARSVT